MKEGWIGKGEERRGEKREGGKKKTSRSGIKKKR